MKKIITILFVLLSFSSVKALTKNYDFLVNGVAYRILDTEDAEVAVVNGSSYGDVATFYQGDIDIPSFVKYKGITYDVTTIEEQAFSNQKLVTSVKLNEGLKNIGAYCFENCPITSIKLPNSLSVITNSAFENCETLENVTLSPYTKEIRDHAFANTAIKEMSIPNTVKTIGEGVFKNCRHLSTVQMPNSITKISKELFCGCNSLKYNIPENVTSIGEKSFFDCFAFDIIEIPASVDSIGKSAFEGCYNVKCLKIYGHLKSVGAGALALGIWSEKVNLTTNCTEVYSYDQLPDNVDDAFIFRARTTEDWQATNDPQTEMLDKSVLYVPISSSPLYHARTGWKDFSGIIEKADIGSSFDFTTFADDGGTIYVNDVETKDDTHKYKSGTRLKVVVVPKLGFEIKSIKMSGIDIEWSKTATSMRGVFKIEKDSNLEISFSQASHDINSDGSINVGDVTALINEILDTK